MLRRAYIAGAILIVLVLSITPLGIAEDGEEPQEPIYESEHHFFRPINIGGHGGEISADANIDVYEEPQEGNDEGLDHGFEREWDEPLYYKGSTKTMWLAYNGYGIHIVIIGPDMGLNTHIYIEIYLRHVGAEIEVHINTGIIPL
jgi:hypothetical protein